jgi:hypothetical protein
MATISFAFDCIFSGGVDYWFTSSARLFVSYQCPMATLEYYGSDNILLVRRKLLDLSTIWFVIQNSGSSFVAFIRNRPLLQRVFSL